MGSNGCEMYTTVAPVFSKKYRLYKPDSALEANPDSTVRYIYIAGNDYVLL